MSNLPARTNRGRLRLTRKAGPASASRVNPFKIHSYAHGTVERIPDLMEFIVSDGFLDRPNLYPRQGTILKTMFLRDDLFTQYDYDVLGEWEEDFRQTGDHGVSPGVLDRIRICKEQGRPWFRETLNVTGRRGSKGYIGGIAGAYVLWYYMNRPGGPQAYYGIDRDKRLTGIVFAGKKEQAKANQWQDIYNVIISGPCFAPYVSKGQTERLTVFAPNDILRIERQEALGLDIESDPASFEIIPSPSTMMAGRGPTSFMQFYDEMAHVIATGANRDAEAVYNAATPSLDQFGVDAFLYEPSSPWQMTGQFFSNWERSIEMDTGEHGEKVPAYPEMVMFQLTSWDPYEDWQDAPRIPLRPPTKTVIEVEYEVPVRELSPGQVEYEVRTQEVERAVPGKTYHRLKKAVTAYDEHMRQLERANPDTFAVERRSKWAEALNVYLNRAKVEEMFGLWRGQDLFIQTHGLLARTYLAHGDPATSNKRFGWAIGHKEWDEETGMDHAVIDVIRCWEPGDYEDHILDYDDVMDDIEVDVKNFLPEEVSFDQFNVPSTIKRLRKWVSKANLAKAVQVNEVVRTRPLNWRHYELFKSAINMGLVHAPMNKQDGEVNYASSEGELELKFLEEKNGAVTHPETGPVQSKDIADAICEVTVGLIGGQMAAFLGQELGEIGISGSASRGTDPYRHQDPQAGPQSDVGRQLGALTSNAARRRGMGSPGPARGMRRR